MLNPALLILAALGPPATPAQVKPAAAEIVVTDRAISLPGLPRSVDQAHAGLKEVKPQLKQARQALEQHLRDLRRTLEGQACPTAIKVPKDGSSDLRFLLSVLNDGPYAAMEESFLKAWDEWHSVLINKGLATPAESRVVTEEVSYERVEGPPDRRAQAFGNQKLDMFCLMSATRPTPGGKEAVDWEEYARLLDQKLFFRKRVTRAIQIRVVADKAAPDLAKSWAPLTDHLNACARRLADLEQAHPSTETAEHRLLRLYANKAFMERMLLAVWFCSVVWAEMTSEALPPLPDLAG
jgi:hypothetical protein